MKVLEKLYLDRAVKNTECAYGLIAMLRKLVENEARDSTTQAEKIRLEIERKISEERMPQDFAACKTITCDLCPRRRIDGGPCDSIANLYYDLMKEVNPDKLRDNGRII